MLTGPHPQLSAQCLAFREVVSFSSYALQPMANLRPTGAKEAREEKGKGDRSQSDGLEKRPSMCLQETSGPAQDKGSPKQQAPKGKLEMCGVTQRQTMLALSDRGSGSPAHASHWRND